MIKAVLREDNIVLSEDRFLLTSLLRACKFKNDIVKTRIPIQCDLLYLLVNKLEDKFQAHPYLLALYKSMLLSAYFGMLRVGEITQGPHTVKAFDVRTGRNKPKAMFILRSSKTTTRGDLPQIIKLSQSTADLKLLINEVDFGKRRILCPYAALDRYIAMRRPYRYFDE